VLSRRPVLRALLAAAAVVLVVLCLVWPLGVTVLAALVVLALLPVGSTLTGRTAGVLLVWLAWSQFAYVVAWPVSWPPRQAVAWTLAGVAVLAWYGVRADSADPSASLRAALPAPFDVASGCQTFPRVTTRGNTMKLEATSPVAGSAVAPAVALGVFAAIVGWWFWPWRGDVDHVLDRMLLGWDHSGHFAMVEQLRTPSPAAADAFGGYPRGYHALVASLMELGSGAPAGLDSELVAYTYAALAVMAASLVLLAAFVLAAPAFRRRPVLVVPAVATLVTVLLQLEDASQVPYYGFGNFLEAAAFAGAGMLLILGWTRANDGWRWFALGTAAAGIVGTWPVLLTFLVPVPVAVWLARRPTEPDALRRLARTLAWALPPVVLALVAQPPSGQAVAAGAEPAPTPLAALDRFLLLDGAVRTSSLGWPIVFALAGVVAPVLLLVILRRRPEKATADARRAAWLWPMPLVALATAWAVLGYEYVRVGEPRYYGIKILCATTLAAGSLAVAASAELLDAVWPQRLPRPVTALGVTALTAVMLLCAGSPVTLGPVPVSAGGRVRADLASTGPELRQPLSRSIRAACEVVDGRRGEYYLLVAGANHEDLVRANVWLISCGLDWGSPDHSPVLRELLPDRDTNGARTIVDLPADTRRILTARPEARVIVAAHEAPLVRLHLTAEQQERLLEY